MSTTALEATAPGAGRIEVRPRRVTSGKTISNLVLLGFGVLFAAPLLWLLFASVDSHAGATLQWPHFTLSNFSGAASSQNMQALLNSFYISLIATIISTVPAALAAYVFSRHHIPFKGPLLLFILMLAGVPVITTGTGGQTDFCNPCLLYTSPSPRDRQKSRMPSSA